LSHTRTFRRDAIVLVLYLLLSLVFTFPLIFHLDTHGVGSGVDDPAQTWSLWWTRYALLHLGTSPLQTNHVFYPVGINLVAYTPTFLNGVLSIPLQLFFSVVIAQNILVLLALALGGYGTYLFVREILARHNIQSDEAAALAGTFYAFGAWHLNYVAAGHFMLLHNQWLPFGALYLIRMDQARWKNGALAGVFFALTAWTELTLASFLALFAALYWLTLLVRKRDAILSTRFVSNCIALTVVAVTSLVPLVVNLWQDFLRYGYYLTAGVGRIYIFSVEPISFFFPSPRHPLLGQWSQTITNANTSYAFIGGAVLVLVFLGLSTCRSARIWALLALVFALLMFGPTLIIAEQNTGIPMPFALLRAIPLVNANRYPVRFNVLLMLMLTPLLALGAVRLRRTLRGKMVLAVLTALLVFEQLVVPIPLADLRVPSVFQTMGAEPGDFAILHLPLGWRGSVFVEGRQDDKAQFYQTVHHKRILGGITSRVPRFKVQYFREAPIINSLIALEKGYSLDPLRVEYDRQVAPAVLYFFDIRYVEVNHALTDPGVLAYAQTVLTLSEFYRDAERTVYRVHLAQVPQIDLNAETARLYFDDGWGRPQYHDDGSTYRWATRAEALLWMPLERKDQTLVFRLRGVRAAQTMTVRVNAHPVAHLTLSDDWQDYAIALSRNVLRERLNEIVFVTETVAVNATRQDNYAIGETGVVSPVDIAAIGAGFDAGRFGEIWVAGRNVIESKRGYHLVVIHPRTGAVERIGSFDTFADVNESVRLAEFIAALPDGAIVAGVAVDDVSKNLHASAIQALHTLGVASDLRFQFRMGHAFIGVKGATIGEALEHVEGRLPANVYVGKNVASGRVAFALGGIEIR